jgi:hypothetical protein
MSRRKASSPLIPAEFRNAAIKPPSPKRIVGGFTSPQLVNCLESKLTKHLGKRLIPDDTILADAYRRALAVATINQAIEETLETAIELAKSAKVPKGLPGR